MKLPCSIPSMQQILGKLTVSRIAEASIFLLLSPESEHAFPEPNIFHRAGQTWTTGSSTDRFRHLQDNHSDMPEVNYQNIM